MGWQLQTPKYDNRPSVYEAGEATRTWVPAPGFGLFSTRRAAVRAYLTHVEKDLKGASDAFLQMHWQTPFYRNLIRVSKIEVKA